MTFEPIDDDEYEIAAARPPQPRPRGFWRRSRVNRAVRRQFAILGVLSQLDHATASDLCDVLHLWPGTIYPDLVVLEHDGSIKPVGGTVGLYRLATKAERWQPEGRSEPRRRPNSGSVKRRA